MNLKIDQGNTRFPDCICTEYDGKGFSPCGVVCPEHYRSAIKSLLHRIKELRSKRSITLEKIGSDICQQLIDKGISEEEVIRDFEEWKKERSEANRIKDISETYPKVDGSEVAVHLGASAVLSVCEHEKVAGLCVTCLSAEVDRLNLLLDKAERRSKQLRATLRDREKKLKDIKKSNE